MDEDYLLDCGCVVGWNHGRWDADLTYTDDCRRGHSVAEAIALAERSRRGEP